jgi:hypothetical protein
MPTVTLDPTYNTANITLSNGNLTLTSRVASAWYPSLTAASFGTGKLYFEVTCNTSNGTATQVGIVTTGVTSSNYIGSDTYGIGWQSSGGVDYGGSNLGSIGSWTTGDTICVAFDLGNQKVWFRKNGGNWDNTTHDPATNTGGYSLATLISHSAALYPAGSTYTSGDQLTFNFGATAFAQAVPSGFIGINSYVPPATTANLTQIAVEQWAMPNAQAQLTQVAVEHWASVATSTTQALLTQLAIEQWAVVPAAGGAQAYAMVLA